MKNEIAGYTKTMCVKCTNGAQTVTRNNWILTQTPHTGCGTVLSQPSDTPTAVSLDYDSSTTSEAICPISTPWVSWDDFFGNTDSENCPISSCMLLDSTCTTEVTSPVLMEVDFECADDLTVSDSSGDTCATWYDLYPNTCGNYDYADFTAASACCECGGGLSNESGVTAMTNESAGYTETLCIRCTNGE
jgi:hypothetical protein